MILKDKLWFQKLKKYYNFTKRLIVFLKIAFLNNYF
jgi:hypothetical protein